MGDNRWISVSAFAMCLTVGVICMASSASYGKPSTIVANDQGIMAEFIQANQFDIDMATVAIKKGAGKGVKELAEMILHDHVSFGRQAEALQAVLGWTQEAVTSAPQRRAEEQALAELQIAPSRGFDDLYLHHEQLFSEGFVHRMRTQWLPSAKHPQLKSFLTDVSKQLDEHMAHVNHVRGTSHTHEPRGH